ncbi:ankyrin repeat domain-containing protein [Comamonas endophytica]|uniref:Ankyrin repeat protein n=1 Tax=Comamonas endophytica TaxID=2949090 RepID=A0ABY6GAZ9_9BURK|nr:MULTISPECIES: ankyrin repeat domain-containing protein [unclassified Acidovorax]MCD2513935.1 hypothetical protein [Acidovorax sp. D4N7]UYG51720.1 hypothetical protein M9799_00200 [Acidovorax sp. 5MLIR]UYG52071.1 hypothetical protein M9799_02155 [Acidovorax sp. 5MLIR]
MAARLGHLDIAKALLAAGAGFTAVEQSQHSAAMLATGNGHLPVVEALRCAGADLGIELQRAQRSAIPP